MAAGSIFSTPKKQAYPSVDEVSSAEVPGPREVPASLSPSLPHSKWQGQASVGEGVHVKGEIHDCRQVDVHGVMEGEIEADVLIIHEKGSVKGVIKTEQAEIHGSADGEITVSVRLDIRATGLVSGTVNYGELSVEAGGRMTGQLEQTPVKRSEAVKPVPMDIDTASELSK